MVYENEEYIEKFILVAVDLGKEDVDDSLDELEELTNTCGGEVVCRVIQPRESIHPGTYIGKGKIEELKDILSDDEYFAALKNEVDAEKNEIKERSYFIY